MGDSSQSSEPRVHGTAFRQLIRLESDLSKWLWSKPLPGSSASFCFFRAAGLVSCPCSSSFLSLLRWSVLIVAEGIFSFYFLLSSQHSLSTDVPVSCLFTVWTDSVLSAVAVRDGFCPVPGCATFEANSIWRFFGRHHLLWSGLGAARSWLVCQESLWVWKHPKCHLLWLSGVLEDLSEIIWMHKRCSAPAVSFLFNFGNTHEAKYSSFL